MDEQFVPKPGSRWLHKNGNTYTVLCVANAGPEGAIIGQKPGYFVHANINADLERFEEYPLLVAVTQRDLSVLAMTHDQLASDKPFTADTHWVIYEGPDGKIWGKQTNGFLKSRTQLENQHGD